MKKNLILLVLIAITMTPLFSFTNHFSYLANDYEYNQLIKTIKDNEPEDMVSLFLDEFLISDPKPVDKARMQYQLVRYYVDNDNKEAAREALNLGYALTEELTDKLEHDLSYAEMVSAEYYLTGKTGTGMESSNLTKALYKEFPDEVTVFLQEANRTLYTPHIAGGSPKRAIEYFKEIEESNISLLPVDQFSLYAGLGVGYDKRNKHDEAKEYLLKAVNIFKGDNSLWKILEDEYGITKEIL